MKKKEVTSKAAKSKSIEAVAKKSVSKLKSKSKDAKKEDSSVFVLVGDSFYLASTKTERRNYEQFEQKVKVGNSALKKSRTKPQSHFGQNINLQEYVKTLSKEEKATLLRDLAKQVEPQPMEEVAVEQQDKLSRLMEKLQGIKGELLARWDDQIGKINHCFENEQIGLEVKNEKVSLIQKVKHHKIAMINYTKVLFEKILREEPDIELEKSERMENIINSLNSISSIDPREAINHLHLDPRQFASSFETPTFNPQNYQQDIHQEEEKHERSKQKQREREREREKEREREEFAILAEYSPNSDKTANVDAIKIEEEKSESHIMSRENLKLDIRLDEVEFGKDHYDEEVIFHKPTLKQTDLILEFSQPKTEVLKLEFVGERRQSKQVPVEKSLHDDFLCVGEEHHIQIPLLMTKDRLEQLQIEKSMKEVETLAISMKMRQSFQVSEIIMEGEHFTTLIDVNQFIVQFYEFVMTNFIREVIEGMNLPYGKSCVDKLYMLRQEGFVPDHDFQNVLTEEILNQFHKDFVLGVRLLTEEEKIHNRALFNAFNSGLNVYRPYFELEGEVFPWNTSEKGLTFYEINEDNIQEVFEKSKMKVLEYCSSLCGLSPDCPITTADAKKVLSKRNEDTYEKILKAEMLENYNEWNIKKINFQALSRINLCQEIYEAEIQRACEELSRL